MLVFMFDRRGKENWHLIEISEIARFGTFWLWPRPFLCCKIYHLSDSYAAVSLDWRLPPPPRYECPLGVKWLNIVIGLVSGIIVLCFVRRFLVNKAAHFKPRKCVCLFFLLLLLYSAIKCFIFFAKYPEIYVAVYFKSNPFLTSVG